MNVDEHFAHFLPSCFAIMHIFEVLAQMANCIS